MDYQLNIYTSNEKELKNVKADNNTKTIKVMQENKLPVLYKKSFGAAAKAYNERAVSGKLIEDYYSSIVASNIPEVYKLDLVIRYELLNKNDLVSIQKTFTEFKRFLDKLDAFVVVAAYIMSFDEYKELLIFFYPVNDGYLTGMSVRNDLIDTAKKLTGTEKETMNIVEGITLLEKYINSEFRKIANNNGDFVSQEELEERTKSNKEVDPMELHSIAVSTLKAQMNLLQNINAENNKLIEMIEDEKNRIKTDLVWTKETEPLIIRAEEERIQEERRREEEERLAEERRKAQEAEKKELDRLKEEERRVEAAMLAEQAKRNIDMRRQMAMEKAMGGFKRPSITTDLFEELLQKHLQWQDVYGITKDMIRSDIPEHAWNDPRRLNVKESDIADIHRETPIVIIGASFTGCNIMRCNIAGEFHCLEIKECNFITSELKKITISNSLVSKVELQSTEMQEVVVKKSGIKLLEAYGANMINVMTDCNTTFENCNFQKSSIKDCDMKQTLFLECDFSNSTVENCDFRNSTFDTCYLSTMNRKNSLFKGVKLLKTLEVS